MFQFIFFLLTSQRRGRLPDMTDQQGHVVSRHSLIQVQLAPRLDDDDDF